jgi:hypothetical protein
VVHHREAARPAVGVPRWAVLWLVAVLLTPGCVTPGPRTSLFQAPTFAASMESESQRLHRRHSARGLGSDTSVGAGEAAVHGVASGGTVSQDPATRGGQTVPRGWRPSSPAPRPPSTSPSSGVWTCPGSWRHWTTGRWTACATRRGSPGARGPACLAALCADPPLPALAPGPPGLLPHRALPRGRAPPFLNPPFPHITR